MARLARVVLFAADEIAIVHVMNRTVRRCFLLGDGAFEMGSGVNSQMARRVLRTIDS